MNLRLKLTLAFLVAGVAPTLYVGLSSTRQAGRALSTAGEQSGEALVHSVQDRLVAIRGARRAAIEDAFQLIEDQVLTFSEDPSVVDAMRGFRDHFRAYRAEAGLDDGDVDAARARVRRYYEREFGQVYAEQNDGAAADVEGLLAGLDDDAVALQDAYIASNPHPLGSKLPSDPATELLNLIHRHHTACPSSNHRFHCDPVYFDDLPHARKGSIPRPIASTPIGYLLSENAD